MNIGPYDPFPAGDGWNEVAEAYTASGKAWHVSACIMDLRWWVTERARHLYQTRGTTFPTHAQLLEPQRTPADGQPIPGEGMPSRAALMRRWNWTNVHAFIELRKDYERWWNHKVHGDRFNEREAEQLTLDQKPTEPDQKATARARSNADTSAEVNGAGTALDQETDSRARCSHSENSSCKDRIPPSPPAGGDDRAQRVAWVSDTAHRALTADRAAGLDVEPYVAAWLAGNADHARAWLARCKPRRSGAKRLPPLLPGAPSGLREREVAEGLRGAAERWRREGPPPVGSKAEPTADPPPGPDDEPPAEDVERWLRGEQVRPPPAPPPEDPDEPPEVPAPEPDDPPPRAKGWMLAAAERVAARNRANRREGA